MWAQGIPFSEIGDSTHWGPNLSPALSLWLDMKYSPWPLTVRPSPDPPDPRRLLRKSIFFAAAPNGDTLFIWFILLATGILRRNHCWGTDFPKKHPKVSGWTPSTTKLAKLLEEDRYQDQPRLVNISFLVARAHQNQTNRKPSDLIMPVHIIPEILVPQLCQGRFKPDTWGWVPSTTIPKPSPEPTLLGDVLTGLSKANNNSSPCGFRPCLRLQFQDLCLVSNAPPGRRVFPGASPGASGVPWTHPGHYKTSIKIQPDTELSDYLKIWHPRICWKFPFSTVPPFWSMSMA